MAAGMASPFFIAIFIAILCAKNADKSILSAIIDIAAIALYP